MTEKIKTCLRILPGWVRICPSGFLGRWPILLSCPAGTCR